MICMCNRVGGAEILKALKKYPDASIEEIRKLTGASGGCGRCARRVKLFVESNRPEPKDQLKLF